MAFSDVEPFSGDIEAYRWVAAQVPPAKEFAARRVLRAKGFAALVPKVEKHIRISRHTKSTKAVHFALMPGYVIVGLPRNRHWMEVYRSGFVRGIVGRMLNGYWEPLAIMVKPLRDLIDEHGDGSNASVMAPATELGEAFSVVPADDGIDDTDVGTSVEVKSGAMAGHMVQLFEIDGDVAKILVPLFGGALVTTPIDNLGRRAQF